MAEYKLGNFEFDTEEEFTEAKKELQLIKAVKDKYDINNTKVANAIIIKFTPKTVIGRRFMIQLHDICAEEENNSLLAAIDAEIELRREKEKNRADVSDEQTNNADEIASALDSVKNDLAEERAERKQSVKESRTFGQVTIDDEDSARDSSTHGRAETEDKDLARDDTSAEDSDNNHDEKPHTKTFSTSSGPANSLLEFAAQVAVAYMNNKMEEMNAEEFLIYSGRSTWGSSPEFLVKGNKVYKGTDKWSTPVYTIEDNVIYEGTNTNRWSGTALYTIKDDKIYKGTRINPWDRPEYTIKDNEIFEGTNTNSWVYPAFSIKKR